MISQHFIRRMNERLGIYDIPTIERMAQEIESRINNVHDSVELLSDRDFPVMRFLVDISPKLIVLYNVIDKRLITCMKPFKKSKYRKRKPQKLFTHTHNKYKEYKRTLCA